MTIFFQSLLKIKELPVAQSLSFCVKDASTGSYVNKSFDEMPKLGRRPKINLDWKYSTEYDIINYLVKDNFVIIWCSSVLSVFGEVCVFKNGKIGDFAQTSLQVTELFSLFYHEHRSKRCPIAKIPAVKPSRQRRLITD